MGWFVDGVAGNTLLAHAPLAVSNPNSCHMYVSTGHTRDIAAYAVRGYKEGGERLVVEFDDERRGEEEALVFIVDFRAAGPELGRSGRQDRRRLRARSLTGRRRYRAGSPATL